MPPVEPVEHAHHNEQPPVGEGAAATRPTPTSISRATTRSRPARRRRGLRPGPAVDEHLVGRAGRPSTCPIAITARHHRVPTTSAYAPARPGGPPRRARELAPRRDPGLVPAMSAAGQRSRPASTGRSRRCDASSPPRRPRESRQDGCASRAGTPALGGPRQRAEVGRTARAASPRSRAIARMYVPAEQVTSTWRSARRVGAVPVEQVERVDGHAPRRELGRLARARQGVGTPAAHFDRAVDAGGRWWIGPRNAAVPPRPRRGRRRARRRASARPPGRRSWSDSPKQIVAPVALSVAEVELHEPGRVAEEDRQDAGRERIERAAVADAAVRPSRRTSATTSCEVGPVGLARTRTPSRPGDRRGRARASGPVGGERGAPPRRHGRGRAAVERQVDGGAGGARVAPAAERAGQHGRVDAAGLACAR